LGLNLILELQHLTSALRKKTKTKLFSKIPLKKKTNLKIKILSKRGMETLYLSKQVCVSFELIITTLLNYYYHAINLVINFLNISSIFNKSQKFFYARYFWRLSLTR